MKFSRGRTHILLSEWRFDFTQEEIDRVYRLFDKGIEPTKVAKLAKMSMKEIMVMLLDWSDKKGEWV